MSYKGVVEAKCPSGCEPFEAEAWTLIRGDREPDLRERIESGELNLLVCPACGRVFYHELPFIYHDPEREFLAFVYPQSYRAEEQRWRGRMDEDYKAFTAALPGGADTGYAPLLLFGIESLQQNLLFDTERLEEDQVAEALALELGLGVFAVRPEYAREQDMPERLPLAESGSFRDRLLAGLERLVAENDRLERYGNYLRRLEKSDGPWKEPPAARPARKHKTRPAAAAPRESSEEHDEEGVW